MDFRPAVSAQLRLMDAALFRDEPMGLRRRLLATPLAQRFELDRKHRVLFINFEGLSIDAAGDIEAIEAHLTALLQPLGERVAVVVNYDSCAVLPTLIDDYSAMARRLSERFYSRVTRYGTGGFLKARLESGRAATR
jgi:propionate CoA-transferase